MVAEEQLEPNVFQRDEGLCRGAACVAATLQGLRLKEQWLFGADWGKECPAAAVTRQVLPEAPGRTSKPFLSPKMGSTLDSPQVPG